MKRNRQDDDRLEHWKQAERDGIADRLADFRREFHGHWGFVDGEVPRYAQCPDCSLSLRVDRLDLIAEHLRVCS